MFSPPGPLTINPLLYGDVAYDPAKLFQRSALPARPQRAHRPQHGRRKLGCGARRLAKANPDKLTYASQGVGSTAFLTAKLFETKAGIRMVHVPHRGADPRSAISWPAMSTRCSTPS